MPNYANAKIYTIRCRSDDTLIYIGSTTQTLSQRMTQHRSDYNRSKCNSLYNYIVNGDWVDWHIELYEYYPCNSKEELLKKEGDIIRQIGTINKCIAGRTQKEWREENVEKLKEKHKKYYEDNAEYIKEKHKKYYEDNIDKLKEYQKEYYEDNADKIKKYREENADIIKEKKKIYREENADKIKKWREENADKIKEKVCCNICGTFSTKSNLARHQNSIKCLSKSLDNTDIPTDTHI